MTAAARTVYTVGMAGTRSDTDVPRWSPSSLSAGLESTRSLSTDRGRGPQQGHGNGTRIDLIDRFFA